MTAGDSVLKSVLIVLGVLLALPVVMMVVMLPLAGLFGWGHMSMGAAGLGVVLLTAVPLVVLAGAGYVLYTRAAGGGQATDAAIEELRAAYARGDLSDEAFERRLTTLREE